MGETDHGTRRRRALRSSCFGLAAAILLGGAPAVAGGGKPAPKGNPPGAAQPVGGLPAGCVRLVDGRHPTLSADGKRLAFGRMTFDAKRTDGSGNPLPIAELWVRDLAGKKEWKLPVESSPDGWTTDGVLLLRAGYGVEPLKGARAPGVAAVPADLGFQRPAWAPDGRQLVIVPRAGADERVALQWVRADGTTRALEGTAGLRTDQAVVVGWSPDGARIYVNALFHVEEKDAVRRVGVVDVATGEMRVFGEMPAWIDIPGHYGSDSVFTFPGRFTLRDGETVVVGEPRKTTWKRPTGPRYGPDVWDGAGRLVAWIEGQTRKEADAFVADVTTGDVLRVTVDGETKWSPAIDPAGRRLAFLMADASFYDSQLTRRRIRVLDLLTGVAADLPIPGVDGTPGTLGWTPDGRQLLYELRGGAIGGVFSQAVPPAAEAPAGAKIVTPALRSTERTVAWLDSPDADRVDAAVDRAREAWDPSFVAPLRAVLARWMKYDYPIVPATLRLLAEKEAKEATPEFVLALGTGRGRTQRLTVQLLARMGAKDAVPELDKLRAAKSFELRVAAAGAMVELGDPRGWETLKVAAKEESPAARLDVCAALWRIRDPVSVDLLIPWVSDREKLGRRWSNGDRTLGDAAQLALTALTGETLGADPAAWKTWWNDAAKRTLPESVPVPTEARYLFDE